ncbi:MAG: BREX-1 system adenine-specific DNA-methyltransferase PglX [Clostridia bacterium]|nr:BREX-1 system adenine-specific DNA-methyltransferase PglX [Clostridia bacterium]
MDKNAIKKFATWARRELIDRVRQQAYRYEVEGADADWNASTARGVVLTPAQRTQRQALIERIQVKGYDATIEEVAYTWFDRFCALRYMEVNGFLPVRTRIFSDENNHFRPQILSDALSIELPGLDIDTVIRLKEENKTEELYKVLLLAMCNSLKPLLTLFQPDDRGCAIEDRDYTRLLLPDNLLREGSVPEQMVLSIAEDDWKDAVQIVGWLYQYYNAEPKDQVFANLKKNIKISKKDIPAATQLFTPDWIVRYMVENSLGRLWVEGHPDDSLKANWKYYLEEAEQEPEVQAQLAQIREGYAAIKPEEILCIDPCAGSGHILVYLFEVLVQIYEAYGYPTRDAVASIVQNNLWGLDIDDRAAQLANFAVMMIARRYDKGWFRRGIQPHVMAIQESNGINRDHLRYLGNSMSVIERNNATTQMVALLDEFVDAKEYGSILQPQEYDWETLRRYVRMTDPEGQVTLGEVGIDATQERLLQIIEQGQALAQKYHVVVTNPPYMNPGNSGGGLADYVKKNYPDSKTDLFAVFIEHCHKMLNTNGLQGMITMHAWMFISSYEKLRNKLQSVDIINLTHLGARAFEEISGEVVQTASFVLRNNNILNYKGIFVRCTEPNSQVGKEQSFLSGENQFITSRQSFLLIPGAPIAYWVSKAFISAFESPKLYDFAPTKQGIATADNNRFLRFWYEVHHRNIAFNVTNHLESRTSVCKWYPYNKGGSFRKWFGNREYVLNWFMDGEELQSFDKAVIRNPENYFLPGCTWSDIATNGFSARITETGFINDSTGPMCFPNQENLIFTLCLLNSKPIQVFLSLLAPTYHYREGPVGQLPYRIEKKEIVQTIGKDCVAISKKEWDSFETSWDFQRHPFLRIDDDWAIEDGAYGFASKAHYYGEGPAVGSVVEACFQLWQKECNDRFTQLKANEEELNRIFIDIYGLQDELTPEVADKDVTVRRADLGRDIRSLVSYAVGCMLGRYSLDKPGLQFAGGDWQQWLAQQEAMTYEPDKDGILPITDDEYFTDDIVTMFVDWVKEAFGEEMLEENLKYIASALYPNGGGSARDLIRQYFLNDFYKDHLKVYQKRPIYWMFDSGKKNGFKCLVYMHRWAKDTVARVRTDYVHEMQSRYRTAIEELSRRVDSASGSERVRLQKQLAKIQGQDAELLKYEEKVHHLADQMIAIDLDDGVKHNYAIFEDVLAPIK